MEANTTNWTVVNLGRSGSTDGEGSKGETAMTTPTKLTLVIAVLATGLVSSASASTRGDKMYYDTIRPHGHPRNFALYKASVNACYEATGESRTAVYDTAAFKQCMLARGYRYQYTTVVQDPPTTAARSVAQRSTTGPSVSITVGGSYDNDAVDIGAIDSAAQQQSQDATDITNAGIAQTVQGINGP
jgi:hypothetical protein